MNKDSFVEKKVAEFRNWMIEDVFHGKPCMEADIITGKITTTLSEAIEHGAKMERESIRDLYNPISVAQFDKYINDEEALTPNQN